MFEYPSKEEWRAIQELYPFEKLEISHGDFKYSVHPDGSMEAWRDSLPITFWQSHLINRLIQTRWSWVMMMYFHGKGIPDKEWHISPGRKGESVEYFPHFTEDHHEIKAQFNYYEDVFYFKLYSAWDTLGHVLNLIYDLGIALPDFHRSVVGLRTVRPNLHTELQQIVENDEFVRMKRLRHDGSHNELPSGVGKVVGREANGFSFGVGTYTTSGEIVDNAPKAMDLFSEALNAIRKQIAADT